MVPTSTVFDRFRRTQEEVVVWSVELWNHNTASLHLTSIDVTKAPYRKKIALPCLLDVVIKSLEPRWQES